MADGTAEVKLELEVQTSERGIVYGAVLWVRCWAISGGATKITSFPSGCTNLYHTMWKPNKILDILACVFASVDDVAGRNRCILFNSTRPV
jgi:hypothetical protein